MFDYWKKENNDEYFQKPSYSVSKDLEGKRYFLFRKDFGNPSALPVKSGLLFDRSTSYIFHSCCPSRFLSLPARGRSGILPLKTFTRQLFGGSNWNSWKFLDRVRKKQETLSVSLANGLHPIKIRMYSLLQSLRLTRLRPIIFVF